MYDAIIVGARVAGSPTAMLLARQGHKVLLVDRSRFPSDIMSTHYIQPEGVVRLRAWGLLDAVAATNCPPIEKTTMHVNGVALNPPAMPGMPTTAYCPRRTVLDKILVDAAVVAGAELREGFSVRDLVFEGDRVAGVRGRSGDGAESEERAKVVIGADGLHSLVARAVHAETYNEDRAYTCGYYSYFSGIEMDGAEIFTRDGAGALAFPTNDGLVCLAVGRAIEDFAEYRSDIEGNFYRYLEAIDAGLAARVRAGKREEKWIGTAETQNLFRKPWGPGWALVGDAGYHKDPTTGLGISDAFRDAEFISEGLHEWLSGARPMEEAMAAYQKRRDEAALPMYQFTIALASSNLPPEFQAFIDAATAAAQPA